MPQGSSPFAPLHKANKTIYKSNGRLELKILISEIEKAELEKEISDLEKEN